MLSLLKYGRHSAIDESPLPLASVPPSVGAWRFASTIAVHSPVNKNSVLYNKRITKPIRKLR